MSLFAAPAPAPPLFSLTGAPAATTVPAFGATAFGATAAAAPAATTSPRFGAAPTAFGGFGATAAAPVPTLAPAPAFGAAPAPAFGGFGATTTPVAAAVPPPSPFGGMPATGGLYGLAPTAAAAQPARTGTNEPRFRQTTEASEGQTLYFNTITAMPEYRGKALEELRWEDYQIRAGTLAPTTPAAATAATGAFGAFGAAAPAATTAPATTAFGLPPAVAPAPATGLFGAAPAPLAPAATTFFAPPAAAAPASPFGAAFGAGAALRPAAAPATGAFAFGAPPAAAAPAATAANPFAAPATGTFGGMFGAPATAAAPATTGLFGAPAPAAAAPAFGAFGATVPAATTAAPATPAFGFGLGAPAPATTASPLTGFSLAAPATAAAPSLFGATAAPAPANPFAVPGAAATTPAGTGLFGAPPLFGGAALTPAATATHPPAVSLFGPVASPLAAAQPQQPLQASIAADPYGPVPNFADLRRLAENSTGGGGAATATASAVAAMATQQTPSRSGSALQTRGLLPRSAAKVRPRQQFFPSQPEESFAASLSLAPGGSGGGGGITVAGTSSVSASSTVFSDVFRPLESIKKLVVEPIPDGGSLYETPEQHAQPPPPPVVEEKPTPVVELPPAPIRQQQQDSSSSAATSSVSTLTPTKSVNKPMLRSSEIKTFPPMEMLLTMDDESLAAVSGFRVFVDGVGSVEFTESVDLRGTDIDATFQFAQNAVVVYPDDATKPAPGTKLNKPCKISIEGCFPRRRTDTVSIERYRKKLETTTQDFGGSNCRYDPASGTWSFELQHF